MEDRKCSPQPRSAARRSETHAPLRARAGVSLATLVAGDAGASEQSERPRPVVPPPVARQLSLVGRIAQTVAARPAALPGSSVEQVTFANVRRLQVSCWSNHSAPCLRLVWLSYTPSDAH